MGPRICSRGALASAPPPWRSEPLAPLGSRAAAAAQARRRLPPGFSAGWTRSAPPRPRPPAGLAPAWPPARRQPAPRPSQEEACERLADAPARFRLLAPLGSRRRGPCPSVLPGRRRPRPRVRGRGGCREPGRPREGGAAGDLPPRGQGGPVTGPPPGGMRGKYLPVSGPRHPRVAKRHRPAPRLASFARPVTVEGRCRSLKVGVY
jgi:hypothetical protein